MNCIGFALILPVRLEAHTKIEYAGEDWSQDPLYKPQMLHDGAEIARKGRKETSHNGSTVREVFVEEARGTEAVKTSCSGPGTRVT